MKLFTHVDGKMSEDSLRDTFGFSFVYKGFIYTVNNQYTVGEVIWVCSENFTPFEIKKINEKSEKKAVKLAHFKSRNIFGEEYFVFIYNGHMLPFAAVSSKRHCTAPSNFSPSICLVFQRPLKFSIILFCINVHVIIKKIRFNQTRPVTVFLKKGPGTDVTLQLVQFRVQRATKYDRMGSFGFDLDRPKGPEGL